MTIVVTGATGHYGRLAVEALLARGVPPAQVVATGRRTEVLDDLAARGVVVRHADYDDPASLDAAFAGASRLLFVSGSEVGKRLQQHRNVVDAAARAGIRHLAYTSAPHADTSPLPVNPDHKATEELIAASGLPATILRHNWYNENYLPDLATARETGEVVSATGAGLIASASRADYAEAAAAVLTQDGHEGKVYELGGDTAWDYDQLAATLSQVVGRPVVRRNLAPDERHAQLVAAGLPDEVAAFVTAMDTAIADGALADVTGDLSRLAGRPTTPLKETLAAG
ncbi:MAG TPA: SDR family oxidoreductase [Cellulomonas sp.]